MMEFEWDEHNRSHLARHGISPEEAEEMIWNEPIDVDYSTVDDEDRVEQIGETFAGRVLVIVTVERHEKIRVVTGFEPSRAARINYFEERRRKDAR